jgi:predicted kinase
MVKNVPNQPLLIMLYGFPGAGKTYFSRQFCDRMQAAHVQADRIRGELFEKPRYDKQENDAITQLMNYMTQEFLNAGMSVIYDVNALRLSQRHALRDMARRSHATPILVWLQTDAESAFARSSRRDRRRADDKYAATFDHKTFEKTIGHMQNPTHGEDYVVVSGKHTFGTQYSALTRRLCDLGLISAASAAPTVKPGLVNLVPRMAVERGRVDISRRNINIR